MCSLTEALCATLVAALAPLQYTTVMRAMGWLEKIHENVNQMEDGIEKSPSVQVRTSILTYIKIQGFYSSYVKNVMSKNLGLQK